MTQKDIDEREGRFEDLDAHEAFKAEGIRTERLHTPPTEADHNELYQAYCDSDGEYEEGSGKRSLFYYSNALFTGELLLKGFEKALAYGNKGEWNYNAFDEDTLNEVIKAFGDGPIYQPARAYSVEILVHRDLTGVDLTALDAMMAVEIDIVAPNVLRLLFD